MKFGFITHNKRNVNAEKVAASMESRDDSAPFTPEDGLPGDPNIVEGGKKDRSFKVKTKIQ